MRPAQLSSETMGGGHQSNRNCILDGGTDGRRQEEDGGGSGANGGSRRPAYQQQQQRYQRQQQEQRRRVLHTVTKPKLVTPFTRFQVLRIIKLATMDKLRGEANEADNRAGSDTQQPVGSDVDGGGPGTRVDGERASDEFHHQFYNTGRIGRRNALPDILGTHCTTTTADLSTQLGALSTSECAGKSPEGSGLSSSIAPPNGGQPPTTTAT